MERTIKNEQAESKWNEVTVDVPVDYADLIDGKTEEEIATINEVLFGIAMKKSNFDVTLRGRIKTAEEAQNRVNEYFETVNISGEEILAPEALALVKELEKLTGKKIKITKPRKAKN